MQFRAELTPTPFRTKITHSDRLFLIGSCFTEQIGQKLAANKFRVLENPNGILFNPVSIAKAIRTYRDQKIYKTDDLFLHGELWGSWDHHTRFSNPSREEVLTAVNKSIRSASEFLAEANMAVITLGSAFIYERVGGNPEKFARAVANCHKMPAAEFTRRLISPSEAEAVLRQIVEDLRAMNPGVRVLFTISPVRHLREGFIDNNRSKAVLIQAVHNIVDGDSLLYFPSYELVLDDLRDYRFYAEDLAHPNYAATNYVWEKFMQTAFDDTTRSLLVKINEVTAAFSHKPFNPTSQAHKKFLAQNLCKLMELKAAYPYMDWIEEEKYFDQ